MSLVLKLAQAAGVKTTRWLSCTSSPRLPERVEAGILEEVLAHNARRVISLLDYQGPGALLQCDLKTSAPLPGAQTENASGCQPSSTG